MALVELAKLSDADLLARYVAGRDQRAFAELVVRHGAMVRSVALRILRHEHDAQDAFQATFLALAVAAARIKRKGAVAAWLHQTAVRSAKSVRRANAEWDRKLARQKETVELTPSSRRSDGLREAIDAELARLPARYRSAIVLCDLEGLSRREAAGRLGLPVSTVTNQLARGRKLLKDRLVQRGVTLSVAGVAAGIARLAEASAAVTPAVATETASTAIRFAAGHAAAEIGVSTTVVHTARGVLRAMTLTKLTMIGAAALAILFAANSIRGVSNMFSSVARAETILIDNFNDGSAADWTEYDLWATRGDFDASSGAYQFDSMLRNSGTGSNMFSTWDGSANGQFSNGWFRAKVRADTNDTFLSIGLRISGILPNQIDGYLFGAAVGNPFQIYRVQGNSAQVLAQSQPTTQFTSGQDWIFEAGALGEHLTFKFWRDGEAEPAAPQVATASSAFASGLLAIEANVAGGLGRQGQLSATFDDVLFTTIPEPPSATLSAIFFAGVFAWQWRRWR